MDIAKLRKKLKEAEARKSPAERADDAADFARMPDMEPEQEAQRPEPKQEAREAPDTDEEIIDDIVELITFKLSREDYAFKISDMEEIIRHQRITLVPRTQPYILGITSLRGKIIPVVDLTARLFSKKTGEDRNKKVLIIKGPKGPVGAVVDRVVGVVRLPFAEITEPPAHLTEAEIKFIEGLAITNNRFISILRIEETLNI